MDEKCNRLFGKAAAGAVIGGVLTGGIGLFAGGFLGGRNKDTLLTYIAIAPKEREVHVIQKVGAYADKMYTAIVSLMTLEKPEYSGQARPLIPEYSFMV